MAGVASGDVHYSTSDGDSWKDAKKEPSGVNAYVLMADDFLESEEALAATTGTDCALSFTRDGGYSWNQISLISTENGGVKNMSFTPDYGSSGVLFVVTDNVNAGNDSLMQYLPDDGVWERIENQANIDVVQVSPEWESDSTVFFADRTASATEQIFRSTDGGIRFKAQLDEPPVQWYGWIVLNSSDLVVGADGAVYITTNNGTTWTKKTSGLDDAGKISTFSMSPAFDDDETLLAGDDAGMVFMSVDAGGKWKSKTTGDEGFEDGGVVYVAFHPDFAENETFFGAGDDGSANTTLVISRWTDEWDVISDVSGQSSPAEADDGVPTGIRCAPDGTLYVTYSNADGMFRALNPTTSKPKSVAWEQVEDEITNELSSLHLTMGSNILWGHHTDDIYTYEDTLTGKVTLTSPSDGSDTGRVDTAKLAWNDMEGSDEYQIRVNTDPGFKGEEIDVDATELTSITVTGLEDGKTYYWKVRVAKGEPVYSNYSDVWSFTTAMGAGQWNPFVGGVPEAPANGATNVPLQPTFAWNAADWATGYEFVLADNPAFNPIVSKTGANALTTTVYLCEATLDYETSYYWKVRAISKTSNSEWASAVFTTMAKAPPPPEPPKPPPTPVVPEPTTPAYIWVIIGIGAALVIAVIILIVRTRRVA
jgi:hypothetical protein